jgi:hypothetical protein
MEIHLKTAGFILILLALIHIGFPQYLQWKKELGSLSLINRQVMWIHTFFIALMVLLTGLLCLLSAPELISTSLGKKISLGLGLFWTVRLLTQFFGYSSSLWKGKRFETIMHILFSMLWVYLSIIFLAIYFG